MQLVTASDTAVLMSASCGTVGSYRARKAAAAPRAKASFALSIAVYPERLVKITVTDKGIGIPDVEKAMEPLFTTGNPEERSGLGFAVMQSFMDKVKVSSQPGKGTRVVLTKRLDERST